MKAARASKNILKVNEGFTMRDRTVGELIAFLSTFPSNASLMMENYNEGTMFNGFTDVTAANVTTNERVATKNDDGPINTATFGFWHEGRMDIALGPKLQAELDAAVAADRERLS